MQLTSHEKSEFKRYAEACLSNGKPARAKLLNWIANSKYEVSLRIYDKCKRMYRAWLVFGEI